VKNPRDFIIAHRGESFDAPENSLSAIKMAWERGAKAVEIDVHLTRDNEIVVIHDYDTLRVSGVKKVIQKTTFTELQEVNIGFYKDKKWGEERIPRLTDVLNTVPDHGKILIEIKSNSRILEKLQEILAHSILRDSQIEIIAFDIKTLALAKKKMPAFKMLWLMDLDGIDAWAGKLLDKKFISEIKKNDLLVYSWTVNSPQKARALIDYGVDGVTTDRAAWMIAEIAQLKNSD